MPVSRYRVTLLVCVLTWFLVGMHSPILHDVIDHGHRPSWSVAVVVVLLASVAAFTLWRLLRAPAPGSMRHDASAI